LPWGPADGYAPVSLANVAGSGNFTFNPVQGFLPGSTQNNSLSRYWGLTPDAGITQSDVTFNYLDADVPALANESLFKFVRRSGGVDTQFTPTTGNAAANTFTLTGVSSFSDWTLGLIAAPTAANVSLSGKVFSSSGGTIANAVVELQSAGTGRRLSVRTNRFGYYRFDSVQSGANYVISAVAKGLTFTPRAVTLVDSVADFDITGR